MTTVARSIVRPVPSMTRTERMTTDFIMLYRFPLLSGCRAAQDPCGSLKCDPGRGKPAAAEKKLFQRIEQGEDVRLGRGFTHQRDAPDIPLEWAEPAAAFDAIGREQVRPYLGFGNMRGDRDTGQHWESISRR